MNIIVLIIPDKERIANYKALKLKDTLSISDYAIGISFPTNRFTVTCKQDMEEWIKNNERYINNGGGPHFYRLVLQTPNEPCVHWDMPRGPMMLIDRLWKPIEIHEAFYEGILD